jgi:hypothetical protein
VVSKYYEELAPEQYRLQLEESLKSPYRISETPFTTVTINYNWRTACHKDSGDFDKGLGNLVVIGENFKGSYLGFPQYKIAVKVDPGDLVIMNVHEWHCNTELELEENSVRLSLVCYLRSDMVHCNTLKIVDGIENYYLRTTI